MATAAASGKKVLRIGIFQDGKSVQERLIKAGEAVSVGESARNTFVLPKTGLPRADFPLFVCKNGVYHLNITENMKGKISTSGAVVAFEKLRKDPSVARQGNIWRVPLTDQDRGKISLDNVMVLFQFVPPPPVQAVKPMEGMDFRPRVFEEDDPVFFLFLGVFTMLAMIFVVFLWLAPEPRELTLADVVDDFKNLQIIVPPIETPEQTKAPVEDEGNKEKKVEQKVESKAETKIKSKVDVAKAQQQRKEDLKSKIRVAKIGTHGDGAGGTADDELEAGTLDAIKNIEGTDVAAAGEKSGLRQGTSDKSDIRSEGPNTQGAGGTEGTGGPAIDLSKYATEAGQGDTSSVEGDKSSVESVVAAKSGQLQYCYEDQLRADPALGGRIEVQFNVAAGRVTAASVMSNTTGNDALAACVVKKVKSWRFDTTVSGPASWPFVFRKKG